MFANAGRVITTFQFSQLFAKAWSNGMTILNIVSGFRKTGIYPFNPQAVLECIETSSNQDLPGEAGQSVESSVSQFSEAQTILFTERYENGYNICTDTEYVAWLQEFHPEIATSLTEIFSDIRAHTTLQNEGASITPNNCLSSADIYSLLSLPQTTSSLPQITHSLHSLPQTTSSLPQKAHSLPQTTSSLPQTAHSLHSLPQTTSALPQIPPTHSIKPPAHSLRPPTHSIKPPAHSLRLLTHSTRSLNPLAHSLRPPSHSTRSLKPPAHSLNLHHRQGWCFSVLITTAVHSKLKNLLTYIPSMSDSYWQKKEQMCVRGPYLN